MNIEKTVYNGQTIAVVSGGKQEIKDVGTALDMMMSACAIADSSRIAIEKGALDESFFILSTGFAGEVLQKFINYRCKVAIYGDFTRYTSKPLRDFIYESNRGKDVFFAATREEALERLSTAAE